MNILRQDGVDEVLFVPYLDVQFAQSKRGDLPVLVYPTDEKGELVDIACADFLDWFGFVMTLFDLKHFDDRVVSVGLFNIPFDASKNQRPKVPEDLHTILQDYLKEGSSKVVCDMLTFFYTDTLLREWPPREEELLQQYDARANPLSK